VALEPEIDVFCAVLKPSRRVRGGIGQVVSALAGAAPRVAVVILEPVAVALQ
jgi:hypothetical protein